MSKKDCLAICKRNGYTPYYKKSGKRVIYAYSRIFEGMEIDKHTLISMGYVKVEQ